jgi:hypothetical protein
METVKVRKSEFLLIPVREKYFYDKLMKGERSQSGDRYIFLTSDCNTIDKCLENRKFYMFEITRIDEENLIYSLKVGEIIA